MSKKKIIVPLFICVLMTVAGIGYSMAASTLEVKGTMAINNVNWDIHFESLSEAVIGGNATEVSRPSIISNATVINNLNVKLIDLSDSITYTFDVVNDGDLDAKISSISQANPICTGSGDNKDSDENLVCSNIGYDLTYADGTTISNGDTLNAGETKKLKIKLYYKGSSFPYEEVNVSDLNIVIIYSQK